jgi:hypothetical protein
VSTIVDLGQRGPHPDVMASLVERINELRARDSPSEASLKVHASDIQMLQQRTSYGLKWTNLWRGDDGDVTDVDVSVGLVVCSPKGGRELLVQYQAHRLPDMDWGIARMGCKWLDEPPKKPWTAELALSRGLGIAWGALAHSPDIVRGRITLADGQVAESAIDGGSLLIFVPFHAAELWSASVRIELLDARERAIATDSFSLSHEALSAHP